MVNCLYRVDQTDELTNSSEYKTETLHTEVVSSDHGKFAIAMVLQTYYTRENKENNMVGSKIKFI